MNYGRAVLSVVLLLLAVSASAADLPVVTYEGRPYVELTRVAASLGTKLNGSAMSVRASIRTPDHSVTFTRNWSQVLVDGKVVILDSPVRVKNGNWLVPHVFVARILPTLAQRPAPAVASKPSDTTGSTTVPSPSVASPAPSTAPPTITPPRASPPAASITLDDMRLRSYPSFTRVVLETSTPLTYTVESRGPTARIKLPALAAEPRADEVRDGYVDTVRIERAGTDAMLRVTFEGEAGEMRVSTLVDPPRLVLDFVRPGQEETRPRREVVGPLKILVLDAGHGGQDSGAVGPTGLMEKDIVLDITRRVARMVEQRLDMKVLLSRDTDAFVTLKDRTSFANRERADLFISIHANAHRTSTSEGVETYFLSSEATDSAARQVAAQENGVVQLEKPAARGNGGRFDIVKSILWDLAQSEFQEESSRLAEVVLDSMTKTLRIPNRGVKQAGFYVLGGAAMPAVLIEIGFVTNPREEKKLRESRYRDEIARAIFEGIAEYKIRWDQRSRTALDRAR